MCCGAVAGIPARAATAIGHLSRVSSAADELSSIDARYRTRAGNRSAAVFGLINRATHRGRRGARGPDAAETGHLDLLRGQRSLEQGDLAAVIGPMLDDAAQ